MTEIVFEKIDTSRGGAQDAGYFMCVIALISGILILFTLTGTAAFVGGGLTTTAVLGYVQLLRKAPKLRYFRYFWLNQDGIYHIEGNRPTDRTAHFTWHEIQGAEASASSDDFRGLILTLKRRGMQGVPVLLTMDNAQEAAVAIQETLDIRHHRDHSAHS